MEALMSASGENQTVEGGTHTKVMGKRTQFWRRGKGRAKVSAVLQSEVRCQATRIRPDGPESADRGKDQARPSCAIYKGKRSEEEAGWTSDGSSSDGAGDGFGSRAEAQSAA